MGHFAGYFKKKEQKPIFFVKIKSLKNKRNAISTTRLVHGSGWSILGSIGPDPLTLGGRWRDLKLTTNINRSNWFWAQMNVDQFGLWWRSLNFAETC